MNRLGRVCMLTADLGGVGCVLHNRCPRARRLGRQQGAPDRAKDDDVRRMFERRADSRRKPGGNAFPVLPVKGAVQMEHVGGAHEPGEVDQYKLAERAAALDDVDVDKVQPTNRPQSEQDERRPDEIERREPDRAGPAAGHEVQPETRVRIFPCIASDDVGHAIDAAAPVLSKRRDNEHVQRLRSCHP